MNQTDGSVATTVCPAAQAENFDPDAEALKAELLTLHLSANLLATISRFLPLHLPAPPPHSPQLLPRPCLLASLPPADMAGSNPLDLPREAPL